MVERHDFLLKYYCIDARWHGGSASFRSAARLRLRNTPSCSLRTVRECRGRAVPEKEMGDARIVRPNHEWESSPVPILKKKHKLMEYTSEWDRKQTIKKYNEVWRVKTLNQRTRYLCSSRSIITPAMFVGKSFFFKLITTDLLRSQTFD